VNSKKYFSNENKEEIIKRYLKDIDIKDLAIQFNCKIAVIEQILRNNEIEIVENKVQRRKKK
jgi:hypothetical protein